jgi:hypothetical protein
VLAISFMESENFIYILPFLVVLFFGAIYLLGKKVKEYNASYQARRDEAAIKLFNAVRSVSTPLIIGIASLIRCASSSTCLALLSSDESRHI